MKVRLAECKRGFQEMTGADGGRFRISKDIGNGPFFNLDSTRICNQGSESFSRRVQLPDILKVEQQIRWRGEGCGRLRPRAVMKDSARAVRFLPRSCDQVIRIVVEPASTAPAPLCLPELDPAPRNNCPFTVALLEIDETMADAIRSDLLGEHRSFEQSRCIQLARQSRVEVKECRRNQDTNQHDKCDTQS